MEWLDRFLPHDLALLLAPTWFTFVGLAGLVTLLVMMRTAKRDGVDVGVIASAILWGYFAALVAGILVPMAIDAAEQYVRRGTVRPRWAGMTSFWGYIAGTLAVIGVCKRGGLAPARLGDLAAAPLGIALCFARLGCFVAGCDFGKVTDAAWAMRFPAGSPAWRDHVRSGLVPPERTESLLVHPTQLFEAALGLAIAAVAIALARRPWARAAHGRVFLVAIAMYAVGRFGVEELRGDAGRGFQLGLSSGQVFAVLLLGVIGGAVAVSRRRAGQVVAAVTALVVGLAMPGRSEAQPAPQDPYPQPQPQGPTQPYPPQPYPPQPYPYPPQPYPYPYPYPYPQPPPPPAASKQETGRRMIEVGGLMGWATPINRRQGQVAPLAGPSLSIGATLRTGVGVWVDFDSLGNDDASHGTVLLSGSITTATRSGLELGGRVGIGSTLVNFDEPAFRDVTGPTMRFEAIASYPVSDHWSLSVRPLSFDFLSHDNLGGPIVTWQMRVGVAYRFGPKHGARVKAPAPGPAPAPVPPQGGNP